MKQVARKNSKKAKIDFGKEISGKIKLVESDNGNKNNNGKRELRELEEDVEEFRPAPRVTPVIIPRENFPEPINLERQVSQLAPTLDNKKEDDEVKYVPRAGDYSANYENKYETKYQEVDTRNLNRNEFEMMSPRAMEPRRIATKPFGEMMERENSIQEKYEFEMARESNDIGLPFEQKKKKRLM